MSADAPRSTSNLPTRQDVLRWRQELERLRDEESAMKVRHAAEEKAVRDRRNKLDKLVEYGMALVDMDEQSEPQRTPDESTKPVRSVTLPKANKPRIHRARRSGKTWTATIKRIVTNAGRGMTYGEVKAEVAKTSHGKTLSRTEKAFYGGIGKLSKNGDIIKHKGRLYSPKAYHKFMEEVAAGRAEEPPTPPMGGIGESPNEIAVKRFLDDRPDGATTSEIVSSLLNNPPPGLAVTKNRNSIYNLLARQREKGKLIKRGDRYYLPSQESEAPGSEEPSAPSQRGDGYGTPSSSGNGASHYSSAAFPGANPAHPGE